MQFVPYVVNGIALGLSVALIALALALIWRTVGMIDFGLGAVYLAAAYAAYFAKGVLGLPYPAAAVVGLLAGPVASVLIYLIIYRFFLQKGASLFVLVLVALSVFTAAQHGLGATVTAQKFYLIDDIVPGFSFLGTRLNIVQIAKMLVSLIALAGLAWFCLSTKAGQCVLAVADNPSLAQALGVDTNRARMWTFGVAGLIVAAAAVPEATESGVDPYLASNPIFLGLAAIIIGGLGRFRNPVLGGLLLGLAFHLAVWAFSSQWQEVVAYSLVLLALIVRPQGLFGGMSVARERA
ncbi:branched-chain amino acid ABC transporter permease [Bradyrhizobium lablabi]|uniref:branched-chain amino acid ABC transporter permease n=1 Tax=Bradyrhizobium lablabi TaxID=722472 RepID=UPI001BAC41E1|nr:branched-chain amino acid ABC transporter permease [Bradyrhizobium lablabi]MBR1121019.1 branched-chain amino acid ABC transporter permease [Bradyrhizobium lablabi]